MTATAVAALEQSFDVHTIVGAADPASVIRGVADRVRGIAGGKVDGPTMEALPKLEIIANSGVGVETNDISTARSRGIIVTNTPDVLNDSVAELTVGLMLALARNLPRSDRYVRDGSWTKGPFILGSELRGKRVGMLGLGRIGSGIAARLQVFGMQIAYHGRTEKPGQPYSYHGDLVDMAAWADWLVAIVPATPETRGIVSRPVLEALGPGGRLVNVARGSLVDQPALIEMLQCGRLGGAALDVFEGEPEVPEALRRLDNLVLSPHQGSRTTEAREAMDAMVVKNLVAHFAGEAPPNRVV
ncbi:2-hydroxyacid dehydrogenase [Rhodobacterales bacterium HKCCE2091]|nr:2-hydroxyacid dehydrogenase [Rhodobacterales bacterium HKCCE2091]